MVENKKNWLTVLEASVFEKALKAFGSDVKWLKESQTYNFRGYSYLEGELFASTYSGVVLKLSVSPG